MNSVSKIIVTLGLPLILLSACATTKAPPGLNLTSNDTLHVEEPEFLSVDLTLQSQGSAVASGTALSVAGAAGGAALGATGGFILGAACGPMIIICGPMGAVAGAGVLGFGGGAAGAAYGGKGFISGDKGPRFNYYVEKDFDEKKLSWKLYEHLTTSAERKWQLDPVSGNVVQVTVTSLRVEQLMEQQIRLKLEAEMTTVIDGKTRVFRITHEGPEMHIDGWLQHEGRAIWTAVESELTHLTDTVVQTLARQV
jgi:hypothetical protein